MDGLQISFTFMDWTTAKTRTSRWGNEDGVMCHDTDEVHHASQPAIQQFSLTRPSRKPQAARSLALTPEKQETSRSLPRRRAMDGSIMPPPRNGSNCAKTSESEALDAAILRPTRGPSFGTSCRTGGLEGQKSRRFRMAGWTATFSPSFFLGSR